MNQERVDELRRQLRALGYLDAGVDRFVLGAATARRGTKAIALGSSLRVGLLAALLLGPAAVVGLGARVPGLLSGVRDALVLAAYLGVVFFASVTVASLAASLTAAAVAGRSGRRAGALASAAGWVVALGTLAYLTFWWRNASAGFGSQGPVLTAAVLALAVLISLLLGHAVRIATLASIAAGAAAGVALPPVPRRSWGMAAAGGAVAFAGAALLLVVTTGADSGAAVAVSALPVVSQGFTLKVLAVDGIDPTLVDEREWVPPIVSGSRFTLEYENTADPARTWTTIATGEPPEVHGIHAIEGRRVAGLRGMLSPETSAAGRVLQQATDLLRLSRPSITSRNQRKVMTFWEVAEAAGLRSAVVNWWATWPAASRDGIVVSDRAVLRLEHGGTLDAEISPPAAYAALQKRWPEMARNAQALAHQSFANETDLGVAAVLIRSATLDAIVLGMDGALAEPHRDLDVVYLPGLDIAQHALLGDQASTAAAPSVLAARLTALRGYHRFLAELIRPWLRPADRGVSIIITAPGRIGSKAAGHLTMWVDRTPPIDPQTRPRDLEIVDPGPPFQNEGTARPVDIAPTILNLLGVPLSREFPGRALPGIGRAPGRYVETYGRPRIERPVTAGKPLDQETIDRLRSLGYIK